MVMDDASSKQEEILKKMSPARKLEVAQQLYVSAFQLKKAWLENQHPDWSQERLEEETRKIFFYART